MNAFRTLQLRPSAARKLEADWRAWLEGKERADAVRSLELRIGQVKERQERLTDLLLDGAIAKDVYDDKRQRLAAERIELTEAHQNLTENELTPEQIAKFLELMKNLAGLHSIANPPEKRCLVTNTFSNRRVVGKHVELEPYNWLLERDFSRLSPMVTPRRIELRFHG